MQSLKLIVGYDRSDLSRLAFAYAHAVAMGAEKAEIVVVEVLSLPLPNAVDAAAFSNDAAIADVHRAGIAADFRDAPLPSHITLRTEVCFGDAAEELCALARQTEADFVFVGTHGRKGLERMLVGSVAERTVRSAPCPVVVVRPREADKVPQVEAACEECTRLKAETGDPKVWCKVHTHHAPLPMHLHYRYPQGFGRGTMNIQAEK